MSGAEHDADRDLECAGLAAAAFAVDPSGLGGVAVRASAGPARDVWLEELQHLLGSRVRVRRLTPNVADARLLGGLDFAATLACGAPVLEPGLLVESHGGVLLAAMAERLAPGVAARIGAVMDSGEVALERDGLACRSPARFGVVLFDEGIEPEETPPDALLDRLAFRVTLDASVSRDIALPTFSHAHVELARDLYARVDVPPALVEALCAAACGCAIVSLRAPLLAVRSARALAALNGRTVALEDDAVAAARLVLAPRARMLPVPPDSPPTSDDAHTNSSGDDGANGARTAGALEERLLEATAASIPADLLARLAHAGLGRVGRSGNTGAGAVRSSAQRGRPVGVGRAPRYGAAGINVVETLRAAVPWQRIRRRAALAEGGRIEVRPDDLRVTRRREHRETTTIFAVDASGSAALHRLAEAKGAVELLLGECYVRRDRVALVAFRGTRADILLSPTRSLVRARRCLAGLPGGGGTPLARGVEAAMSLALAVERAGGSAVLVLLTDGCANVDRRGLGGRAAAEKDALGAARAVRAAGIPSILIDTSPQAAHQAARLAREMGARYLPLPHADARSISRAVTGAAP
jgi:magnesium chelatase subunit D